MIDRIYLVAGLNIGLIAFVFGLVALAKRNPRRPWVFWLFAANFGPRTDTRYLTKHQLLDSSLGFFIWGFMHFSFVMALALGTSVIWGNATPSFFLALLFVFSILCGMGFLGGGYMFIRYLFRPKDYIPPSLIE